MKIQRDNIAIWGTLLTAIALFGVELPMLSVLRLNALNNNCGAPTDCGFVYNNSTSVSMAVIFSTSIVLLVVFLYLVKTKSRRKI